MATLVFDIETAGLSREHFDEFQQGYLFREADQLEDESARESKRDEIEKRFSLWPLTAQVVCIAMMNADTERGKVLFLADDYEPPETPNETVIFEPCMDEIDLLGLFWEAAKHYDRIVTFNGRRFDVPFLYLRSAALGVPISKKNWLGYRFNCEPHCDLADQLSFYGVSGRDGAARNFNLDFYCKSFGIASPKGEGITGADVPRLLEEGRTQEIAEYCVRDTFATLKLYHIWKERLAGIK
jgi:3'-5' exonuclease